jgi:hypothetical protein
MSKSGQRNQTKQYDFQDQPSTTTSTRYNSYTIEEGTAHMATRNKHHHHFHGLVIILKGNTPQSICGPFSPHWHDDARGHRLSRNAQRHGEHGKQDSRCNVQTKKNIPRV